MPRVTFVKKARKDNPAVSKGESYYHWKFRFGGKHYSVARPRSSQLTQSAYYGAVRGMVEQIEDTGSIDNEDDLIALRDSIVEQLEGLRDETQDSRDNMPEALQDAPTGELLQERVDALEEAIGEIENIDESDANWSEVAEQEDDHQEWSDNEPKVGDFKVLEAYEAAYEEWEFSEPEVDDLEDFDLSAMADAVGNAEV